MVDGTEDAPDAKNAADATEFEPWKKQHGITQWIILLAMEWSLQQ
jgi:hypothetical protein